MAEQMEGVEATAPEVSKGRTSQQLASGMSISGLVTHAAY